MANKVLQLPTCLVTARASARSAPSQLAAENKRLAVWKIVAMLRIARRRNPERSERYRLPALAIAALCLVTLLAGGALFWVEEGFPFPPKTAIGWILFVIAGLPLYFVAEGFLEAGTEGLYSDRRWLVRLLPIVILVALSVWWYAKR